MKMIKNNKLRATLSSLIILFPAIAALVFLEKIKLALTQSFGTAYKGALVSFLILPVILLAVHWLCLLITDIDARKHEQSPKIYSLLFWIIPAISLLVNLVFLATILGGEVNIGLLFSSVLGFIFILVGNYMPKCKPNYTFGIKCMWTFSSEENWYRTHRLAGWISVIVGLCMFPLGFLPASAVFFVILGAALVVAIVPLVYSFVFYKKQLEAGELTDAPAIESPFGKKGAIFSVVMVVVTAALVVVLMFSGSVEFTLGETELVIDATFSSDLTLSYGDIDSVELRHESLEGMRVNGYSSARLQTGYFRNDELGNYLRYTYGTADTYILLTSGEAKIAIAAEDSEATEALYRQLIEKVDG